MNQFSIYKNTLLKYYSNGQTFFANSLGNNIDESSAIALSPNNNIFVAGHSISDSTKNDFVIIKYTLAGNREWIKSYNGPADGIDIPHDIKVSNSEKVYVGGKSYGGSINKQDFVIIKFSSTGIQEWVKRINHSVTGDDAALNVAIDSLENIYASGFTSNSMNGKNFFLAKLNSNSEEIWNRNYNGTGNGDDIINAITLDTSGNVIVSGTSLNEDNNYDTVTIKYNPDGKMIWQQTFDAKYDDKAVSTKIDKNGNIFITGSSGNAQNDFDYVLVKYDTSGQQLWAIRYAGSGNGDDIPSALSVDDFGNIYVSGSSYNASLNFDYLIVMFDNAGEQKWVYQYDNGGDDVLKAAHLDEGRFLFATGSSKNLGNNFDYFTLVLDSNGLNYYSRRFNNITNKDDYSISLAVSKYPRSFGFQNVFLTGTSYGYGTLNDIVSVLLQRYVVTVDINSNSHLWPDAYRLFQNYPNPFNPKTSITYQLPKFSHVSLKIYDINGKEISQLIDLEQDAGTYSLEWDARNYSSGIYFYKLSANNFSETRRMILTK